MSDGGTETAAVEVDQATVLATGENDAPIEGVASLRVEQADTPQEIERIAVLREMTAQAPARSVADAQFLDQSRIAHSALLKVTQRFGVGIELLLIERGSLLEHSGRVDGRSALLLEVGEALAERQMAGQLDKANQIATLATAVAVEEIFASIDVERRLSFPVQRTESDELGGAVTCRAGVPVLLPQIIEQRLALFEFFDVLPHGAFRPETERRRRSPAFPGEDGGWEKIVLRDAGATREFAQSESAKTKAKLGDRPDHCVSASDSRGQAFGAERKRPAGSAPNRSTNGGVWKGRARD